MVFRKPYKSGSCLHDTLAFENGDNECRCGALNIDGNRVGTETRTQFSGKGTNGDVYNEYPQNNAHYEEVEGRYPAQTFCNEKTAEVLDRQSGVKKSSTGSFNANDYETKECVGNFKRGDFNGFGDIGGCSKILHKCNYEKEEQEQCLQLYQKYAIMKEKYKGDKLWENANIVEAPLQTKEKELGSAQKVVQQSNQQKTEIKNLQNYLSVFNVEWSSLITQQTELEKIVSVLKDVQHYLDLEKINQNVLYVVKNVISTQIDTVLKVAKTLITGIMESLESGQPLQLGKEAKYMEDLIIDKVDFVIPMLSVLFAITKPEIDTTQTITFLKKYIMFVKVATQKYIEEISSCHDQTQYQTNNYDIYFYKSKVSKSERNAGCDEFEEKLSASSEFRPNHLEKALNGEDGNPYGRWKPLKNNHPTLKPIALNEKILKLFKTPNDDKIVYPFAGSGSEIIGGIKAGFKNWVGCEINPDYVEIAKARIDYWTTQDNQLTIFDIERE